MTPPTPPTQDLTTLAHEKAPEAQASPALRLVVVEGPDTGQSLVVSAQSPRVHIGTSSICELRLTCKTVSRRHLAIEPRGPRLRVIDLGSTNGTTLRGVPIVEAFLRPDDVLCLGATTLRAEPAEMLPEPPRSAMRFGRVLGASVAMRSLYPLCERLAKVQVPTLIEGEKGTGKELLAESLHEASGRSGPFVVLDCGAGRADAIAAELFGAGETPGLFQQGEGGTLLLDEVGELPRELHARVARAIERVNVRVLASSRRDLDRLVQAGRFEEALFARLGITRIELPPLRARAGDIALLARYFVEALGQGPLDPALAATLEDYAWPGNVTELKSAVTRLVLLGDAPVTPAAADDGDFIDRIAASDHPFSVGRRKVIEEFERRYVEIVLEKNGGNVSRAAAASGVALRHFQRVKSRHR